jgi:hypothetical protein
MNELIEDGRPDVPAGCFDRAARKACQQGLAGSSPIPNPDAEVCSVPPVSVPTGPIHVRADGHGAGRSALWRTGLHEASHIFASRFQNLELAGSTLVEGPDYQGLTWGPGSKRALRGKAAYDGDGSAAHDAVAVRVADNISRFMTGPGEDGVADIFSSVQARVIDLMAGGAGEMIFLGDAPPMFMASDLLSANALAGIICRSASSRASFIEHCFQEALAIIEANKPIVLALARALLAHPKLTLDGTEIDAVIATALAAKAADDKRQRGDAWKQILLNAAEFAAGLET